MVDIKLPTLLSQVLKSSSVFTQKMKTFRVDYCIEFQVHRFSSTGWKQHWPMLIGRWNFVEFYLKKWKLKADCRWEYYYPSFFINCNVNFDLNASLLNHGDVNELYIEWTTSDLIQFRKVTTTSYRIAIATPSKYCNRANGWIPMKTKITRNWSTKLSTSWKHQNTLKLSERQPMQSFHEK